MRYLSKLRDSREKLKSNENRNLIIPVLSLVLALATIASNVLIAQITASRDYKLKQYEVTYKLKCDYYSEFHKSIAKSVQSLIDEERVFSGYISDLEGKFFKLEPLLSNKNRLDIKNDFLEYTQALNSLDAEIRDQKTKMLKPDYIKKVDDLSAMFAQGIAVKEALLIEEVYASLFEDRSR